MLFASDGLWNLAGTLGITACLRPGWSPFCPGLFYTLVKSEARFGRTMIRKGFGAFMHKVDEGYRRRAIECFAFAKNARADEERTQLLIMANNLMRLAVRREQKTASKTES